MNSRERIIETLNHRMPDRVAIDLGATNATGISAIVYAKLKNLLGVNGGQIKVFDLMQQLAEPEIEVLDKIGGDVVMLRRIAPALGVPIKAWKKSKLTDGTDCLQATTYNPVMNEEGDLQMYKITDGSDLVHPFRLNEDPELFDKGKVVAKLPKGSHAFCRVYHPFANVNTIEELDKFGFPEISEEELEFIEKEAKILYETTEKAICGIFYGNVFEIGQVYWGYQKFFENLMLEPELMQNFFQRRTDAYIRDLEKYLKAVGKYINIIDFCDDLGTQSSLLMSPEMYREVIKPLHARMFGYVRKNYPDVKVFFHTCGAVYELIPDLIEAGIQILNPIQFTASGMDPVKLKKEFGKQLVFWGGGIDTQHTLHVGTIEEVKKMAKEMLDIFSPGGGYVFSQVHNIESCVPAENVLAAFNTAKNY
jgi:uroporphyrinogen decarboxylase